MKMIRILSLLMMLLGFVFYTNATRANAQNYNINPFVSYIEPSPGGSGIVAVFGYESLEPSIVQVLAGSDNFFSPIPADRGQPTVFLPGYHPEAFRITYFPSEANPSLIWNFVGNRVFANSGVQTRSQYFGATSSLQFRGVWSNTATYVNTDLVNFDNNLWIGLTPVTGVAPGTDTTGWLQIATQSSAPGAQGPAGQQGPQGDRGLQGEKGEIGPQGIQGLTGPPGSQGDKGDTGIAGATGEKGEIGATGAKGDKGDKGATGQTGATGAQGTKGDKGDKGDTGTTGAQGPRGDSPAASNVFTLPLQGFMTINDVNVKPNSVIFVQYVGGGWGIFVSRVENGSFSVSGFRNRSFRYVVFN